MCGRYIINPDDRFFRDLAEIINRSPLISRFHGKQPAAADGAFGGEVTPASVVPVIAPNRSGERSVFPMQWGFTLSASGGGKKPPLIINARSETAADKPLFRDSWAQRRCVIPASGYFEWEHSMGFDGKPKVGTKYLIAPKKGERTYLAGLYRIEEGLPVFAVLTRAPAADLFWMHDRMPVMLPEEKTDAWLSPQNDPEEILASALTETVWEPAPAGA